MGSNNSNAYDDGYKVLEYNASSNYKKARTNIEAIITELERKYDGSLDFEKKDIVKETNSIAYTIKGNTS